MADGASSLRIANMLSSDGPGGAEVMMLRLSEQLRANGHTVVPVSVAGGVGWLGDQYERIGFHLEEIRFTRSWFDRVFLGDVLKVLRSHSVEVVHSHEFEMAFYGALACRLLGLPHVITMHGGLTVWKAWQRRVALRWAIRNSSATYVVSEATREQFSRDLSVPIERLAVIRNGVPVRQGDAAPIRAEFGFTPDDVVILAVGNLERNKGHRELLQALNEITRSGAVSSWRLIIAGGRGGPEHEYLAAYIQDNALGDRVHIALQRTDIPNLQAAADVFVMPSLWEGLPMALLEGMAAGNAVVASKTGGIPEAVADGQEGLLVPPGDVPALTVALRRLLVDTEYRRSLADAARKRALAEFTVEVMSQRYEDAYRQAISGRRRASRK